METPLCIREMSKFPIKRHLSLLLTFFLTAAAAEAARPISPISVKEVGGKGSFPSRLIFFRNKDNGVKMEVAQKGRIRAINLASASRFPTNGNVSEMLRGTGKWEL